MTFHSRHAFTLIELLIVVVIIAILAALAIPNMLQAQVRAKVARTQSDMRTIALAWEARNSEKGSYTAAGFTFPGTPVTPTALEAALTPSYMKTVPKSDGWGYPFQFAAEGRVYAIRSPGRDGVYEGATYVPGEGEDPDCDIVYSNGNFVRYPAGIQKQ